MNLDTKTIKSFGEEWQYYNHINFDNELIAKYLPDLINAARVDGAPDSYKRFVNKLKGML
jgi:hypothetical protein